MSDTLISIPKYNLPHIAMNCHFNVGISLLSSLDLIIEYMQKIENPSEDFILLGNAITNCNLQNSINITKKLKINILSIDEAEHTFKKLMKVIYEKIPKNIIQYWDASDDFNDEIDKKLTIHQLIHKYQPQYFICNIQDFNTVLDIKSSLIHVRNFNINPLNENQRTKINYNLHAVVVYYNHHFFITYCVGNEWLVRDCIPHKPINILYKNIHDYVGKITERNYVHSFACYVKNV